MNNKILLPKRIIALENVVNPDNLFVKKELQIHLNEKEFTTLSKGSFIILDFGQEIAGGIRILTKDITNKCGKIHIRFGESVGECSAPLKYKGACNDHSPRDFYYDISFLSDVTLGQTGFRFVRIDVEEDIVVSFKNIYAVSDDVKRVDAYFKSNDCLLNQIFDIAAYTNALCHKNGFYYDGIKRDRLVWIGDSYPIYKASKYLYLKDEEILNSLEFAMIETPLPGWVNFSPMYSFWWMFILCDYYLDHGDYREISHLMPYLEGIIHQSNPLIKDNGDLLFPFLFIDWPSHYDEAEDIGNDPVKKEDEITGCRFLVKITLEKVLKAFKNYLKEEDVGLILDLINRLNKGNTDVIKFKQIAALGVEASIKDTNKVKILTNNGANGLSTFLSYFIFKALDELGYHDLALSQLKEYYGKMIDLGATTFFEDFDITWSEGVTKIDEMPRDDKKDFHGDHGAFCYRGYRHSLCHGWSSGVVAYIYEYIVGVSQLDSSTYEIKPSNDNLNIECSFATKNGLVELIISNGKVINFNAPDEIKIIIK